MIRGKAHRTPSSASDMRFSRAATIAAILLFIALVLVLMIAFIRQDPEFGDDAGAVLPFRATLTGM